MNLDPHGSRPLDATDPPGAPRPVAVPDPPAARVFRARHPGDVLALVPCVLGFHPQDSVVLLPLGAEASPFFARVDLPVEGEVDPVVTGLAAAAGRHGVAEAFLAVYSTDHTLAAAVADAAAAALAAQQVGLRAAVRADGRRWFCLQGCTQAAQCPTEGTPYDVSGHPALLEAVVEGRVIHESREALRATLDPLPPEHRTGVAAAVDTATDRLLAASRHPLGPPDPARARRHLVQEGRWVQRRVRRFLQDRVRLDDRDAGRMLVGMLSIEVRDVAWAEMARDNARHHVDLWRDLVRRAPEEVLAPPAALLAFASWLSGDGALAWCAVDRCQAADPAYSLADLVGRALAGAVSPSEWQPLEQSALTLFAG